MIAVSEFFKRLNSIGSQHVLIITNTYLGQDIFKPSTLFYKNGEGIDFYDEINDFKARQMLTSGGIQPILDEAAIHSEFGIQFLSYPRNTDLYLIYIYS